MELVGRLQRGAYVDSITLMQAAEEARALPGVVAVAALIASPSNRAVLVEAALWPDEAEAADPGDIVLAVRAETGAAAQAALERMERWLRNRGAPASASAAGAGGLATTSRSIASAARATPGANLAVISVAGAYAAAEAHHALSAGLHVFLFSDGVSLADEVALKRRAQPRGLLVMGPECGTSIIAGVGLGFANRVRRGPIGLVGASGTGLQEVTSLIHRLGGGISHAIGTGGRDLDESVGGLTTRQALAMLGQDDETRAIVLVSKPPSARVALEVLAAAAATGKPVIACLLGWRGAMPAGVRAVETLEETAFAALEAIGRRAPPLEMPSIPVRSDAPSGRPGGVRGLFTGGTLAAEARALLAGAAIDVVDFGAEEYTRGRPHPMIDPELRRAAVATAGDDAATAVVLLDVVLGDCAYPDPAGAVGPAIDEARARAVGAGRDLAFVAHVVGTDDDPQRLGDQEATLRARGVIVSPSNRIAALTARDMATGRRA